MSAEFLAVRWSSFGGGGESSSCATSLFLSYAFFAMLLTLALSENGVIIQADRAIHPTS
jgi:hypothetical protein